MYYFTFIINTINFSVYEETVNNIRTFLSSCSGYTQTERIHDALYIKIENRCEAVKLKIQFPVNQCDKNWRRK